MAAAALAAIVLGAGAPAQAGPVDAASVQATQQTVQWDPETWLTDLWPSLPFGDRATLEITDLSAGRELPNGSHQRLAGFVAVDRPDVVRLDREFVASVRFGERRRLLALSVHELTHSAIFWDGGTPPRDVFEITEADRGWAGPLLDSGLRDQWLALEAIADCSTQAALPPGTEVYYLSGQCPTAYRDAAFEYLSEITGGADWRPQELKADRALFNAWSFQKLTQS
ncbi:hypothetical protein D3230_09445 [Leucobacter chromiireducens subsp. solipictus]|uniref:DUF4157 domain-containing protein n=1 Tax=Leucobacter chromiireducens subsp. solipictus TaxID=398235 RepID=A0ABS1SG26_9MICO|nr:hypothetical protein [Leucobacter chromiireducens subsp. solipictus]